MACENMRELSMEELRAIQMNILDEIHNICEEQGLGYSLFAGTLLGAVRHKGFIPWDDDLDIFMPRPDYEKLIQYCMEHKTSFRLVCSKTDKTYGYLFAKAVDDSTFIVEDVANRGGAQMGVFVDIFPVDSFGDTPEEAQKNYDKSTFLRELLVAANWKKYFRNKTRKWYYEPIRFAFFVLSRFFSVNKLITKIEAKYPAEEFGSKKYVATLGSSYRKKRKFDEASLFDEYVDLQFEDRVYKAVKNYDEHLTRVFGNYMQLPPEKDRVTHHYFKAYYKDK
ncbi:MAG: LicD family protein [Ruminococcaceae bacterium]|nr:LicD family protein [Oscillospiraceae bacterium]